MPSGMSSRQHGVTLVQPFSGRPWFQPCQPSPLDIAVSASETVTAIRRLGTTGLGLLALLLAGCVPLTAQTPNPRGAPPPPPFENAFAEPIKIDRSAAAVWQSLRKLNTRGSLMMIVAHPDDEDGGMLTYESRDAGADTTLLTLNRGEGGQNLMSADFFDQLGLLRTQELLAADQYYGVHQMFTRVIDFGFSKTMEETLKNWGHDRVLYDCVRAVRLARPLVVTSVFAGNVSDGHGHHQVSGLMAQEVYKAAGDPAVFPDQIAAGLRPWSPLKVYARVPFARVTEKGIYDYATGHWEPVRFRNYVTGTWIEGIPSATVTIPEDANQPLLGGSAIAIAREGLAEQKSQNGGVAGPSRGQSYHLYASRVAGEDTTPPEHETDLFEGIDTTLAGIADYAPAAERAPWRAELTALSATVAEATAAFRAENPAESAPALARGLAQTEELLAQLKASQLPPDAAYNMRHELELKRAQFNDALGQALGLRLLATAAAGPARAHPGSSGRSSDAAATLTTVPGQKIYIDVHLADNGPEPITALHTELHSEAAGTWTFVAENAAPADLGAGKAEDAILSTTTPADAALTRPYFSRPDLEQGYYDLLAPQYLDLPEMPYTLAAETTYRYAGVEAHLRGVVQTAERSVQTAEHSVQTAERSVQTAEHKADPGPSLYPLLTAPAISLTLSPEAGIVPLGSTSLELSATVYSSVKGPAQGHVHLELPHGWRADPAVADFATQADGDERTVHFRITPSALAAEPYTVTAVADFGGKHYRQGFQSVGYPGLRPYPYYRDATYRTTGVDVKVAPGLKIAYVTGTGDDVAESLGDLGLHVTTLSAADLASADLSAFDAIVLGIRAYAARPELRAADGRLLNYAKAGGVVLVQYQTAEYNGSDAPYPLTLPADAEKVVEEDSKVTLLAPQDPLLNWPNRITAADFHGWVEERGHGFLRSWDPHYRALTEMHDAGQDPQRGGLVYTPYGKGAYIYLAFAFFREMPSGVPGSFRLMANLLSLGKNPELHGDGSEKK